MTQKMIWRAALVAVLFSARSLALAEADGAPATAPLMRPTAETVALDVASPHYGAWGYDASGQDRNVRPGKDFYQFANGRWIEREQIPADRTRFGNFDKLSILSENRTRLLIEAAGADIHSTDADAAKVGAAYRAFMDQAGVDALDAAPLKPELDAIRAEASRDDVARLMGRSTTTFQSALFDLGIDADEKAPTRYAVYVDTAGMGLPDRDYYLQASFAAKKTAYAAYVAKMLGEIGWPDPQAAAGAIVALETDIAKLSWTKAAKRDVDKTYNPMTVEDLSAYAPGFDFKAFLDAAGLSSRDHLIVQAKSAFPTLAATFAATPLETLKAWQAFHLVDNAAPYLSGRFVQARFEFRNKTLYGQPQIQPRWKRAVRAVDGALGEAVGRLYVAKYFTTEDKAKMDALVSNLKAALAKRISGVSWMSPATKAKAREKLAKFTVKIGYPAKWRDYSALRISPDDLYGDMGRAAAFEWNRKALRLDQPVDKLEWEMTPQTVNAYYNPTNNEIVFPAAILQPPFFDAKADPAINYGGIGGVIGHEMTHGFDDQGREFDGDGAIHDWWTPEDAAQFKTQTKRLGDQFSAFEAAPGVHVNGDLTMGENIADLGGVLLALDAYHTALRGRRAPVIGGLSGDQRLFLGWAQVWREKIRDDALRAQVVSDPHSPAHFRVDGPLRNVDAWYAAFHVRRTDLLYLPPEQRARIW